jgi:hypothetical protein
MTMAILFHSMANVNHAVRLVIIDRGSAPKVPIKYQGSICNSKTYQGSICHSGTAIRFYFLFYNSQKVLFATPKQH